LDAKIKSKLKFTLLNKADLAPTTREENYHIHRPINAYAGISHLWTNHSIHQWGGL